MRSHEQNSAFARLLPTFAANKYICFSKYGNAAATTNDLNIKADEAPRYPLSARILSQYDFNGSVLQTPLFAGMFLKGRVCLHGYEWAVWEKLDAACYTMPK